MTIRFVLMNGYSIGGTIRTTFTTAAELAKRHDVEIVSVYRRQDEPALPLPAGVRFRALTDLRAPRGRRRAWAAGRRAYLMSSNDVRYRNFNLLTDFNLLRYLLPLRDGVVVGTRPAINLAIAGVVSPSVVRVGQDHVNLGAYKPALQAQIGALYPRLDVVAALTERDAEDYRHHLRGRTRVEWIPNGVPDLGGHRAQPEANVVVAAGWLSRNKAFDRLLPVWARLAPRFPDWQLRIFGGGEEMGALRAQIEELGIGGSARLMGFTSDLPAELARASLFVMTSRKEGFPMVLLEAMGVGLPVVAYDCPTGPRDIVRDGVDGHVVPDGDEDALAAAMSGLMADAERRRAFGDAALEGAARYDIGAIAQRWEHLLAEVAAAKGTRRRSPAGPVLSLLTAEASRRARRRLRGR